jgi:glycosyltransferase involved in cell wall biosynthesis
MSGMKPSPISVSLIAGAEEARIARTLASVAGWTSEVVVVLNHDVTDRTEAIAREAGARVYREPWKGFVGQKNASLEKTTQRWVLGLDCDEVVTPELRDQIVAAVEGGGTCAAYSFPRKTWFGDRWILHGDWYPDRQTRLWKRGSARWGGAEPHAILQVDGAVGRLSGDLEHHSGESVEHHVRKALRYAEDFNADCQRRGRRVGGLDLVVRPPWRFLRSYVVKRGFLDGWAGFDIAWMSAFYTFLRYQRAHRERRRVDKT